ncbi:hypothetical protein LNA76_06505 [Alcaligenes sp. MMA]|uniref:hypothetical protein n=1 Tax=Alcaligenes sp. MMA TaxID=2893019 RepID=UPI001E5F4B10|nr:hypothetical protein [Alcaligenes sp. MMA]MCC9162976.1 hypothetical protein [Alcaligenes sp. MMA]
MGKKKSTESESGSKQALPVEADITSKVIRKLTDQEILELRQDMEESSAWAKAELARRRQHRRK